MTVTAHLDCHMHAWEFMSLMSPHARFHRQESYFYTAEVYAACVYSDEENLLYLL